MPPSTPIISAFRNFFIYGMYASYVLFAIALTGVYKLDPSYLSALRIFLKYFICILLIVKFNPFTYKATYKAADVEFNRHLIFHAAVFLLLATTATNALIKESSYIEDEKKKVNSLFKSLDLNKDGVLEKGEFMKYLKKESSSTEDENKNTDSIFKNIDLDHDGVLEKGEFIKYFKDHRPFWQRKHPKSPG